MKREDRQMIFIYFLVFIIIILLVLLTKTVLESRQKEKPKSGGHIEKIEINPYPIVNDECTFSVGYLKYNELSRAGCEGGYTRYDLNDITLNNINLPVSVIFSDKNGIKTGIFINNKRITSIIDDVTKIKFGIFDNKLFILDTNNNESNVLAFDETGKKVYDLKEILEKSNIKDLSTGDTDIKSDTLDPNSFSFAEGTIEFNSISNTCQNGEQTKGSHYKITYKDSTFEKPEFISLVNCS